VVQIEFEHGKTTSPLLRISRMCVCGGATVRVAKGSLEKGGYPLLAIRLIRMAPWLRIRARRGAGLNPMASGSPRAPKLVQHSRRSRPRFGDWKRALCARLKERR
jgi:hypothetical protein